MNSEKAQRPSSLKFQVFTQNQSPCPTLSLGVLVLGLRTKAYVLPLPWTLFSWAFQRVFYQEPLLNHLPWVCAFCPLATVTHYWMLQPMLVHKDRKLFSPCCSCHTYRSACHRGYTHPTPSACLCIGPCLLLHLKVRGHFSASFLRSHSPWCFRWISPNMPGWLTSQPQGSTCLFPQFRNYKHIPPSLLVL